MYLLQKALCKMCFLILIYDEPTTKTIAYLCNGKFFNFEEILWNVLLIMCNIMVEKNITENQALMINADCFFVQCVL